MFGPCSQRKSAIKLKLQTNIHQLSFAESTFKGLCSLKDFADDFAVKLLSVTSESGLGAKGKVSEEKELVGTGIG